jgi:hypothetical protein
VIVHGPVHASWLNQIEIHFSIIRRKVLTPNDFHSLPELEKRLLGFQSYYEQTAKPFEWKFTRRNLIALLNKIQTTQVSPLLAAQAKIRDRIYEAAY